MRDDDVQRLRVLLGRALDEALDTRGWHELRSFLSYHDPKAYEIGRDDLLDLGTLVLGMERIRRLVAQMDQHPATGGVA